MKSAKIAALALCLGLALGGCNKLAPGDDTSKGLEGVRAAIVARNFGEAVDLAAVAVSAHPKDPAAHFEQARAEAFAANEGRALDALDKAISLGLPDAARALEDPAFVQISGSDQFAKLLAKANPVAENVAVGNARTAIVAGAPGGGVSDGVAIYENPNGGTHIRAGDVVLDTDF